eukprot:scaffold33560_cov70-Isochrysis_galbana.AAC.2
MLRHEHRQHHLARRLPRTVHPALHLLQVVGRRRPAHDGVGVALHVQPLAVRFLVGHNRTRPRPGAAVRPFPRSRHRRQQRPHLPLGIGKQQRPVPGPFQRGRLLCEGLDQQTRLVVVLLDLPTEGALQCKGVGVAGVEPVAFPFGDLGAVGAKAGGR